MSTNLKIKNIVEDLETEDKIITSDSEKNFKYYLKDTDIVNDTPNSTIEISENHVMDETLREDSQSSKNENIFVDYAPEISNNEKITKVICKSNPNTSLENSEMNPQIENQCIYKNEDYLPEISNDEKVTKSKNESFPETSLKNSEINSGIENQCIAKKEEILFHCNQCERKFKWKKNLSVHIQTQHEGIKFPCVQCDKQFSHQGSLLKHFKSKHQGITYSCKQCVYEASECSNLKRHIQSQH